MSMRVVAVLAVLAAAGCSSGGGTTTSPAPTPSATSPAGNWSGSITDPVSGDGTMQLTLTQQSSGVLTGTWSASFRNGDSASGSATAGQYAPPAYGVILYVDPVPPCTAQSGSALIGITLINVAVSSNRLTAVAGRMSCGGFGFGAVNLSK